MDEYAGKVVAVLSYSSLAYPEAEKLRESGTQVIIGMRTEYPNFDWEEKGFKLYNIWDAVDQADVILVW